MYDDEVDYGEESEDSDELPHPSYQKGFFKEGSPIGRFMADRNKDHQKQSTKKQAPTGNRRPNPKNPYFKLLDWNMLDLGLDVQMG